MTFVLNVYSKTFLCLVPVTASSDRISELLELLYVLQMLGSKIVAYYPLASFLKDVSWLSGC